VAARPAPSANTKTPRTCPECGYEKTELKFSEPWRWCHNCPKCHYVWQVTERETDPKR
jgi:ssDNA-binding Zn-finger/Zn-ribbon topoisomerase 1